MARACPKCGYENPATEAPDSEKCPKCGLIYSKFEAVAERRAEEAQQKEAEARQKAEVDTIEAEKRMKEQQEKQKQEEASRPKVVVKTYKGTQTYAIALFQQDAAKLATKGYFPTSQTWAPGAYGCGSFLIALLLCVVLIGILMFVYMLIVKPDGTLTVTYELRTIQAVPPPALSTPEKTCPQCAEQVKAAARVCRFCGYKFNEPDSDRS